MVMNEELVITGYKDGEVVFHGSDKVLKRIEEKAANDGVDVAQNRHRTT